MNDSKIFDKSGSHYKLINKDWNYKHGCEYPKLNRFKATGAEVDGDKVNVHGTVGGVPATVEMYMMQLGRKEYPVARLWWRAGNDAGTSGSTIRNEEVAVVAKRTKKAFLPDAGHSYEKAKAITALESYNTFWRLYRADIVD